MVKKTAEGVGSTVGGMVGSVICATLFGLPGELLGGIVGGEVGEKAGPYEKLGREAYHSNFGGECKDSEPAYTLRQRTVQGMGSSALNSRLWLGKEAVLNAPVRLLGSWGLLRFQTF